MSGASFDSLIRVSISVNFSFGMATVKGLGGILAVAGSVLNGCGIVDWIDFRA